MYRFGVQAAQNLDQSLVHLLRGALEELATASHEQGVTCRGDTTSGPRQAPTQPEGSATAPSAQQQEHGDSQAVPLSATKTLVAKVAAEAGNSRASQACPASTSYLWAAPVLSCPSQRGQGTLVLCCEVE